MTQLRDHALETLDNLQNGKIGIQQAMTNVSLYSAAVATVNAQMQYSKLTETVPQIPFMQCAKTYDHNEENLLENKDNKSLGHDDLEDSLDV